jgi:hypothetical protein
MNKWTSDPGSPWKMSPVTNSNGQIWWGHIFPKCGWNTNLFIAGATGGISNFWLDIQILFKILVQIIIQISCFRQVQMICKAPIWRLNFQKRRDFAVFCLLQLTFRDQILNLLQIAHRMIYSFLFWSSSHKYGNTLIETLQKHINIIQMWCDICQHQGWYIGYIFTWNYKLLWLSGLWCLMIWTPRGLWFNPCIIFHFENKELSH